MSSPENGSTSAGGRGIATVVNPRDCVVVVGIPLEREGFDRDLASGSSDGFVRFCRSRVPSGISDPDFWELQYGPTAAFCKRMLGEVERLGVTIVLDADEQKLRKVTAARPVILTIVSHHSDASVELCDRMWKFDEFAGLFPEQYEGFIDLTMCGSFGLGEAIKRRHRRASIQVNRSVTGLKLRLAFYAATIRRLAELPQTYSDALVYVAGEALALTKTNKR